MKICFAASSGGHFEQLMMLKPLMEKYESFVVTEKTGYEVKTPVKCYYLQQVNRRQWRCLFYLLKNTVDSLRLLHKEQPDVVVCAVHGSQALRQEADLHRVICQSDFGHTDGKTVISLCGSFLCPMDTDEGNLSGCDLPGGNLLG